MKDVLKRMFGVSQTAAQAAQPKEEVTMTTDVTNEGAGFAAQADVSALQVVAALTEQLNAANARIAELQTVVDAATEFKAAQEKVAAEARIAARTAKLAAVVGDEQAASLQAATVLMDDTAFEAVVTAMTSKATTEAKTKAFTEVGVQAAADPVKLAADVQGSRVADYLRTMTHETQAN